MKGTHPKYKQGKFKPRFPKKYKGNVENILYRSGLELQYFHYCDRNKNIIEWASEELFVPYKSIDGKTHRYFVDLWVKVKDKDTGEFKEFLCEIKPASQCHPPKPQKRVTQKYKEKVRTYLVNKSKWDAAEKFAEKNGCKFILLTENDIRRRK